MQASDLTPPECFTTDDKSEVGTRVIVGGRLRKKDIEPQMHPNHGGDAANAPLQRSNQHRTHPQIPLIWYVPTAVTVVYKVMRLQPGSYSQRMRLRPETTSRLLYET